MKLATTTADFYPYLPDKSVAAPLTAMPGTPFRHIDMSFYHVIYKDSPWIRKGDDWKREIDDCLAIAEANGYDFIQAHSPDGVHFEEGEKRDALINATVNSIRACEMLGIRHTVSHAGQSKAFTPTEFIRANTEFYRLFADTCEKCNVDILTENSAEENMPGYYIRTGHEAAEFVAMAGLPRLHVCWDTGHANMRGNDPYKDITALGSELHALHVQDNHGKYDSHLMPMGGTINFDRVLQGLIDIGFKDYFTFEGHCSIRHANNWPHFRNDIRPEDRLHTVPLFIQQKQINVMYEIGKWMLSSYNIFEE